MQSFKRVNAENIDVKTVLHWYEMTNYNEDSNLEL